MTEERENTREIEVYRYIDDEDLDMIIRASKELNPNKIKGNLKITIEFHPEDEVEDET